MKNNSKKSNENQIKFSKTIEELYAMLKDYQEKHGDGGCIKFGNQDFMDGYARAISDMIYIMS